MSTVGRFRWICWGRLKALRLRHRNVYHSDNAMHKFEHCVVQFVHCVAVDCSDAVLINSCIAVPWIAATPWYTFQVYTAVPHYTAAPIKIMAQLERFYATPNMFTIMIRRNKYLILSLETSNDNKSHLNKLYVIPTGLRSMSSVIFLNLIQVHIFRIFDEAWFIWLGFFNVHY